MFYKNIFAIYLFIILLVSIETQTYNLNITHGIVAGKNNTLNNAFQKYKLNSIKENADGINTFKHGPLNGTKKK